jgi:hypothetical protein
MNMHWCTGKVNLSGQGFTVVIFEKGEPMSWPEAQVLMALHGEENVYDIKPCATTDVTPRTEKERLLIKYGLIAEKIFPGYSPRMEMLMPGEPEQIATNGNGEPKPGPAPDDDDEGGDDLKGKPVDPPAGPAVFKPGKHQPPHKGA